MSARVIEVGEDLVGFVNQVTGMYSRIPQGKRHKAQALLWSERCNVFRPHYQQCALGLCERHERGLSGMAGNINLNTEF